MEWVEKNNDDDKVLGDGILTIIALNEKIAIENSKLSGLDTNSNTFRKHLQDLIDKHPEMSKFMANGKLIYTTGNIKQIAKEKWEVSFKTFNRKAK